MPTEPLDRHAFVGQRRGDSLRECRLDVVAGPDAGKSSRIAASLVVGTDPTCGLALTDTAVSGRHVEIVLGEAGAVVRDLGSRNGTWLGGSRVPEFAVEREATFCAGRSLLRLHVGAAGEALPPGPEAFGRAVGETDSVRRLFAALRQVAGGSATVLIQGETGTGKEILAEAVHAHSPRRSGPFVVVDCGAVAPGVVESELFGHVRGSFTGATANREGALLRAHGGTVFLDEVGELSAELQPKLLRFLESGTVKRVGEDTARGVDARVVAATHRDLDAAVREGRFRSDLFYRLAVVVVRVPPLRERVEDIPLLFSQFVAQLGHPEFAPSEELLAGMRAYAWPGNVRELRNVVERVLAGQPGDLPNGSGEPRRSRWDPDLAAMPFKQAKQALMDSFLREYFTALFERSGRNVTAMAASAGIARTYAHRLIKKLGLKGVDPSAD